MRIATAAYPLDWFDTWQAFAAKTHDWVSQAAESGADLLVFPEYGAMELSTLDGRAAAWDLQDSLRSTHARMPAANALYQELAVQHGVHILGPSAPVFDSQLHPDRPMNRPVNRAHLFAPNGKIGFQDKQIMTLFERDPWGIVPGAPLSLFDTSLGKIGVLICYDCEFPLLSRALIEAGAEVILVPSCTEALSGYWRVRIGAMARALEGQCVVAMASLVGDADWSQSVETNTGMGGIFGPPDIGFPDTGVLATGVLNTPGWTYADVDLAQIAAVRAHGIVRNAAHWDEHTPAPGPQGSALTTTYCDLR